MSANSKKSEKNSEKETTAKVLYQKLGDKWFAFSVVDEEVYMAAITPDDLNQIRSQNGKGSKT